MSFHPRCLISIEDKSRKGFKTVNCLPSFWNMHVYIKGYAGRERRAFSGADIFGARNESTLAFQAIRSQIPPRAEGVGHKDAQPLFRPVESNLFARMMASHLLFVGKGLQ